MSTRRLSLCVAAAVTLLGSAAAGGEGFTVSNHSILETIDPSTFKDPGRPTGGVQVVGVKNGTFASQIVVVGHEPIKGLTAAASALAGPDTIPAEAVRIRYALPDGEPRERQRTGCFDSLEDRPPAEVQVFKGSGRAIQPIWITVTVPANVKPGDYAGTVTVTTEGAQPVQVPLRVRVIDWTLPDANAFAGHMDIVQSPESVAIAYGVKPWSQEHLALLDKTFALLRPLAVKTLYISCIRRTHFGNEHAMVRWYRDSEGELQPDFDHVEQYLDLATRHLGKVPGVILYCWEPVSSMGHAGGTSGAGRTNDRPIQYTLWDPTTDRLSKRTGPAWGTPEARVFWKKLTDGLRPILERRGLQNAMLFGLIGDARPTKVAMDDVCNGVKDAKWAVHSHHYCADWQGYDIGMCVALWGIHLNIVDPEKGRGYGWQNPSWLAYYPREFSLWSPLPEYRFKLEMWLGAFSLFEMKHRGTSRTARGLGRIGADFWKVLFDRRHHRRSSLAGRYPESYWGQLNLNYCIPYILGQGTNGPVPTVRSEAFREGAQEAEARVFIEKAIVPEDSRARVGEDLAKRCRAMLDARIRMVNRYGGARQDQRAGPGQGRDTAPDWKQSRETLFRTAAEVARKLGN